MNVPNWVQCTDATTGLQHRFNFAHIACVTQARNTSHVVLSSGDRYEVEEEAEYIMQHVRVFLPLEREP